jgi:hypothetical protein
MLPRPSQWLKTIKRQPNGAANWGFLKKAKPLRRSWFQLLRAGKLAGKLAVIECC